MDDFTFCLFGKIRVYLSALLLRLKTAWPFQKDEGFSESGGQPIKERLAFCFKGTCVSERHQGVWPGCSAAPFPEVGGL